MAQKTAISFLNTQVQTLSTTVSNQGASAVTAAQFSSLSSFVSTLALVDFTNLSTQTSTLTTKVNNNSTSISSLTSDFNGLSTHISSLGLETVSTGVQALQTFSTAQISTNVAQNTAINSLQTFSTAQISTNVAQNTAVNALQTFSTAQISTNVAQNTSITSLQTFSTAQISTNISQNTSISVLQSFSSTQAVLNIIYNSASTSVGSVVASTALFNLGRRRGQAFNGPFVEFGSLEVDVPKAGNPNGSSAQATSTIMGGDPMRGPTLINNTGATDSILPLYMGIATNGYNSEVNMVPSTAFDSMRFAHIGVPGTNSSITINLVSSGSTTAAITMAAGDVVTMIFKGTGAGGPSSPSNYFFIPSL